MKKVFLLLLMVLIVATSASAITIYEPDGTNIAYAGVSATQAFNYTVDYEIPPNALRDNIVWEVKAGYNSLKPLGYEIDNVTVTTTYNDTHLRLFIQSQDYYTTWHAYNGTSLVLLKTTTNSGTTSGTCPASTSTTPTSIYDDDFSTSVYTFYTTNYYHSLTSTCSQVQYIAKSITEEGVYWDNGELGDVTFSITNELGNSVDGVSVSITRNTDDTFIATKSTDLTGLVKFELADDISYSLNVTKDGYDDFVGNITIVQDSYGLIIQREGESLILGNVGLFSMVTSPSTTPVSNEVVNFTIQVTELIPDVNNYGLTTVLGNTTTTNNGNSGEINVTLNLSGHERELVDVTFFINHSAGNFTYNYVYYITNFNASNSTLAQLEDEVSGLGVVGKTFIGTFIVILLVLGLVLGGLPGDWAAGLGGSVGGIAMIIAGLWPPIIGGIVVMIVIGMFVVVNAGGIT